MGFDISITLTLQMCPTTGKPFYYTFNKETKCTEKVYGLPAFEIPKELQTYLVGRGHLFYAYTKALELDERGYNVGVDTFLENYPSWEEVMEDENFSDDFPDCWNEEDHQNFQKLLDWCVNSGLDFHVSWSY